MYIHYTRTNFWRRLAAEKEGETRHYPDMKDVYRRRPTAQSVEGAGRRHIDLESRNGIDTHDSTATGRMCRVALVGPALAMRLAIVIGVN